MYARGAVASRGMGALSPSECRKSSVCSAAENAWCYSLGAATSACIAWRAGLDEPPKPLPPVVPPIDTAGGSTAANPDYGRTTATVEEIIAQTAEADRRQLADWLNSQANRPEQPKQPTDGLPWWAWLGIGGATILALHEVFAGGR